MGRKLTVEALTAPVVLGHWALPDKTNTVSSIYFPAVQL